MRSSFVFDANRCTGCQACQLACVIENGLEPDAGWRQIHTFNERRLPGVPLFHLSLACNHCAEPACMEACPALAYSQDARTGAVLIDEDKCIGCRYCSWACPYDAPRFDEFRGVMTKCTFCVERIRGALQPACAELCPTGALQFDRLEEGEIVHEIEGFPRSELRPSIRIVPLREGRQEPECSDEGPEMPFRVEPRVGEKKKVSLRSEWSLAAFTLIAAVLFGVMGAAVAGAVVMSTWAFLGGAAVGMGLATVHLGRKTRAWRAVLGVRTSWLSREVVFFSAFVVVGTAYLAWMPGSRVVGGIVLALGVAALVSMDRVYRYAVRTTRTWPHSAGVLLTGLFLAGVLAGHVGTASVVGAVKIVLYAGRKFAFAGLGMPVRPEITALRIGVGLLLPAVLWVLTPGLSHAAVIAAVLAGEIIDRCEFYADLDFPAPERQLAMDLAARSGI